MIILETNTFWTFNGDFWSLLLTFLGIGLSAFGLNYSIKAFKEAKLAKQAANDAGIVVKTQEIMMELERISNECIFNEEIKYHEATNKLNEISSRVYGILGIYRNDEEIKAQAQIIQENFNFVKTALENANPSNPQSGINDDTIDNKYKQNYVYNMTSPYFTNLINSLSTLKGVLNSRLIRN
jgi:hypothetical protein